MVHCRSAGTRKQGTRSSLLASREHVAYTLVGICDGPQGRTLVRLFHCRATATARIRASLRPSRFCNHNFAPAVRIRTPPPFALSQSHRSVSSRSPTMSTFSDALEHTSSSDGSLPLQSNNAPCGLDFRRPGLDCGLSGHFHCAEESMGAQWFTREQLNFIYHTCKLRQRVVTSLGRFC
jgi:hypothetical protein